MAIKNFIPTVWSENLYKALERKYVAVSNCNREFEGDIKNLGSVVKICGVGNVIVSDYTKNTDMSSPQTLEDTVRELKIDQAKYFNFQIDDIDRAQSTPKLMDAAMSVAAEALAAEADRYIYSLCDKSKNISSHIFSTPEALLDYFIDSLQFVFKNGAVDAGNVVIEVSPAVATQLVKAKINMLTDNKDALENGCIGNIAGCKVFVTNNLRTDGAEGNYTYCCIIRTTRAVAFAEQLSEIEAYRPENRFADAVKGLHLYGAEIVYPDEFATLEISISI